MLEDLVTRYLDALDRGYDNEADYRRIKEMEGEEVTLAATVEVARILHYRRVAEMCFASSFDRFMKAFDEQYSPVRHQTLQGYFTERLSALGVTWIHILRRIEVNVNQADRFQREGTLIVRFLRPTVLARLAKELAASGAEVLRLARQELESTGDASPASEALYRAGRFRMSVVRSGVPATLADASGMYEYLDALESELRKLGLES